MHVSCLLLLLSSAFTNRMSSAIQWQRHQLSAVSALLPVCTGDVRRRQVEGLRLCVLQFPGGGDQGRDGDEWTYPCVEAAVRGIGAAQRRA